MVHICRSTSISQHINSLPPPFPPLFLRQLNPLHPYFCHTLVRHVRIYVYIIFGHVNIFSTNTYVHTWIAGRPPARGSGSRSRARSYPSRQCVQLPEKQAVKWCDVVLLRLPGPLTSCFLSEEIGLIT